MRLAPFVLLTAAMTAVVIPVSAGEARSDAVRVQRPARAAHEEAVQGGPPPLQRLGTIRGRLDVVRVARPVARRPEVAQAGSAGPRDLPDLRRGVVYLESAPRGAFEDREPGRASMDQRNETFVPHVLAVTVGTVVDFPNNDTTFHNVFSLSKTRRFDLGRYAAGQSKSVRFDRPGIVRVFCDIHSHMNAFILVFSHPFFDVTSADGAFRIDRVPAGTYTVIGWYEGEARISRQVTVPPGGTVDLELTVP